DRLNAADPEDKRHGLAILGLVCVSDIVGRLALRWRPDDSRRNSTEAAIANLEPDLLELLPGPVIVRASVGCRGRSLPVPFSGRRVIARRKERRRRIGACSCPLGRAVGERVAVFFSYQADRQHFPSQVPFVMSG